MNLLFDKFSVRIRLDDVNTPIIPNPISHPQKWVRMDFKKMVVSFTPKYILTPSHPFLVEIT